MDDPDRRVLSRLRRAGRVRSAVLLLALMGLSVLLLRSAELATGYWIDEGLSVGIANRPLTEIPGVLRQDGSPPAYYMLLHGWMALTGAHGPRATHWLSVIIATVSIPVAWALVRPLLGARSAWFVAALVAGIPFLNLYAQETRMYALVASLSLIAAACFVGAFALRRGRGWLLGFAVAQALLLYTHNWGWFFGAGCAAAWGLLVYRAAPGGARRGLVKDGLLAAAVVLVLLIPWLPTLVGQVSDTGAPWANPPTIWDLLLVPIRALGVATFGLLALAGGAGVAVLRRRPSSDPAGRAVRTWAVIFLVSLLLPWLMSQVSPAWAYRYSAVAVGPLVLGLGVALAATRGLGIGALALATMLWLYDPGAPRAKSNVAPVALATRPALAPGDLVVSTQPEQIPLLNFYWRPVRDLTYATLWGRVSDVGVTDWRDGVDRLEKTSPRRDFAPLLDDVRPGGLVALVQPITSDMKRWRAPWTALVRQRSNAWEAWLQDDRRFELVARIPVSAASRLTNSVSVQLWMRRSSASHLPR